MDEQYKQLIEYLIQAIQFGKEQLPQVANEILRYELIENYVGCGILLAFMTAMLTFGRRSIKKANKLRAARSGYGMTDDEETARISGWVVTCLTLIPTVGFIVTALEIVQIYVAPRLYLLQYAKGFLK